MNLLLFKSHYSNQVKHRGDNTANKAVEEILIMKATSEKPQQTFAWK